VINKILTQSNDRDRLLRFIQYGSKFLSAVFEEGTAVCWQRLEMAILTARQYFRLLRGLDNLLQMHAILTANGDSAARQTRQKLETVLQFIRQLSYFLFFLIDHFTVLAKTKVFFGADASHLRQIASCGWTLSSISGFLFDLSKIMRAKSDSSPAYKEICLDGVRNLLDIVVGWNLTVSRRFSRTQSAVTGACGVMTAGIQCYQIYETHRTGVPLSQRLILPEDNDKEGKD